MAMWYTGEWVARSPRPRVLGWLPLLDSGENDIDELHMAMKVSANAPLKEAQPSAPWVSWATVMKNKLLLRPGDGSRMDASSYANS